jgi:hypothetical protein
MRSESKQSPRGRLRGRPLCGAKTRAGGSCRSEQSLAKPVAAFTAANRPAQGHKLVSVELRRPSADDGAPIERDPGRATYPRAKRERRRREKRRYS